MKFNVKNVMTTAALVGLLSTTLPANVSFAEDGASIKKADIQNLSSEIENNEEVLNDENGLNSESFLLVPGDFYYFVQKTMESIQLKLATNDHGRVMKLTEFATRKMEMAYELIEREEFEAAEQLVEEALTYYGISLDFTEEQEVVANEEEDVNQDEAYEDGERSVDLEGIPSIELDEDETGEVQLHQSIVSLLRNIEKIQNPTAKDALTRNVERKLKKMGIDREVVFGTEEEEIDLTEEQTEDQTEATEETVVEETETSKEEKTKGNGREHVPGQNKEKRENKVNNGNGNNNGEKVNKDKGNKQANGNNNRGNGNNNSNKNGNGKGNSNR